jgi:hypothetical protein
MKQCSCPRCSSIGQSVGAMNYNETQLWDTSGNFRESGLVFGKSGNYSEHTQSQSKRAATFEEPQPYCVNSSSKVIPIVLIFISLVSIPLLMNMLGAITGQPAPNVNFTLITNFIEDHWSFVIFPIAFYLIFSIKNTLLNDEKLENQLNTEVWPKQLALYNQLSYCSKCHCLFDSEGKVENANPVGFQKMMALN